MASVFNNYQPLTSNELATNSAYASDIGAADQLTSSQYLQYLSQYGSSATPQQFTGTQAQWNALMGSSDVLGDTMDTGRFSGTTYNNVIASGDNNNGVLPVQTFGQKDANGNVIAGSQMTLEAPDQEGGFLDKLVPLAGEAFLGAGLASFAGLGPLAASGGTDAAATAGALGADATAGTAADVAGTASGTLASTAAGAPLASTASSLGASTAMDTTSNLLSTMGIDDPSLNSLLGLSPTGSLTNLGASAASGTSALSSTLGAVDATGSAAATGAGGSSLSSLLSGSGLGQLAGIAANIYGVNSSKQVASQMDPFGPYRQYFANQLMSLEQNPSSVTSMPGYQASIDSGLQALQRTSASQGLTGSGQTSAAIANYAGQFENQYFNQQQSTLAQLAGAGATPGAGAVAANNGVGTNLASIAQLLGAGSSGAGGSGGGLLGTIGTALGGFFN